MRKAMLIWSVAIITWGLIITGGTFLNSKAFGLINFAPECRFENIAISNIGKESECHQIYLYTESDNNSLEFTPINSIEQFTEFLNSLRAEIIERQGLDGNEGKFGELIKRFLSLPSIDTSEGFSIEPYSGIEFAPEHNFKQVRFVISGDNWELKYFLNIFYDSEMKIVRIKDSSVNYIKFKDGNQIYGFFRHGNLLFPDSPNIPYHSWINFYEQQRFLDQKHNDYFETEDYFKEQEEVPFKKTDWHIDYFLTPHPEYIPQIMNMKKEVLPPQSSSEFSDAVEELFSLPDFIYDPEKNYHLTIIDKLSYDNNTGKYEKRKNYKFGWSDQRGPNKELFSFYSVRGREGNITLLATEYFDFQKYEEKKTELNFHSQIYPGYISFKFYDLIEDLDTGGITELGKTILFNLDTTLYKEIPGIPQWEY